MNQNAAIFIDNRFRLTGIPTFTVPLGQTTSGCYRSIRDQSCFQSISEPSCYLGFKRSKRTRVWFPFPHGDPQQQCRRIRFHGSTGGAGPCPDSTQTFQQRYNVLTDAYSNETNSLSIQDKLT